jgi:hypothetical protein
VSVSVTPRVEVMRLWETALRGMTGTRPWGGSYANAPTVERGRFREIDTVNKFPHLILLPYQGSRTVDALMQRDDDLYKALVVGYVGASQDPATDELVQHLIRDCKVTLLHTVVPWPIAPKPLIQIDWDEEEVELYDGRAAFALPFTAHLAETYE